MGISFNRHFEFLPLQAPLMSSICSSVTVLSMPSLRQRHADGLTHRGTPKLSATRTVCDPHNVMLKVLSDNSGALDNIMPDTLQNDNHTIQKFLTTFYLETSHRNKCAHGVSPAGCWLPFDPLFLLTVAAVRI